MDKLGQRRKYKISYLVDFIMSNLHLSKIIKQVLVRLLGAVMLTAVIFVLINILANPLYGELIPRIRFS